LKKKIKSNQQRAHVSCHHKNQKSGERGSKGIKKGFGDKGWPKTTAKHRETYSRVSPRERWKTVKGYESGEAQDKGGLKKSTLSLDPGGAKGDLGHNSWAAKSPKGRAPPTAGQKWDQGTSTTIKAESKGASKRRCDPTRSSPNFPKEKRRHKGLISYPGGREGQ